jgi:hypothetical protein
MEEEGVSRFRNTVTDPRKTFIVLALLALVSFCLHCDRKTFAEDYEPPEDEDCAIYSAAIKELYLRDGGKAGSVGGLVDKPVQLVVIHDHTIVLTRELEEIDNRIADWVARGTVDRSAVEAFKSVARNSTKLDQRFTLPVKYTLVSEEELKSVFKSSGLGKEWKAFYKQYPDSPGYIWVSRPGLNSKRDQALLYVARVCGTLCGSGYYLVLSKTGGEWTVKQKEMIWIS